MLKYEFNKINDEVIQIFGEVNGWIIRNENGAENINHFDFIYKYLDRQKRLIKVRGVCKRISHMNEIIEKELKNNY